MTTGRNFKSAFVPLLLIWLALHAVVLAALLGMKFLLTKFVVLAMLLVAATVFLVGRFRTLPRSHSPVI